MDISAVNGGTFNFTGGTLNVTMDTPGDGVLLKPNIFNPDCFQFQELSLDGFGEDDVFLMDFRFGNPQDIEVKIRNKPGLIGIFIDIRLVEDGNVKETVSTGKNGVTTDDIGAIRVDFLGNGMLSTQVFDNNGNQIGNTGHLSGVVGFGDEPIEVTIVGEDIMRDPVFHLGTLTLTTTHVPEPSTLTLLGIGALTVFGYVCKRHKRLYGSKEAH